MADIDRYRSPTQLLARVLDQPELVASVQALPGDTLAALVRRVGVEDAGEILAMATSEQLVELFDGELWEAEGGEEQLSPERFVLWLEVLAESGEAFVADRLAALPESMLVQAFAEQLLVLDVDALALMMSGSAPDHLVEKALEASFAIELDRFLILSKRQEGWDAVSAAVLALDERHGAVAERVLEVLCGAAMEQVDDNGLYEVLSATEALAEDAAAEREDRRTARGYVSVADARAFAARRDVVAELIARPERDAVAKAYFRRLGAREAVPRKASPLDEVLADAGIGGERMPRLTAEGEGDELRAFREAMGQLQREAPELFVERLDELAFVTNVLVTLGSASGEPRRASEAAMDAARACARGLARVADRGGVRTYPLDVLYRIGRGSRANL